MDENFKKYKRKYKLFAIIKSVICGLSFGLLVIGVLLLALKLNAILLNAGYYVLIGFGAAIVCGGLMFLLFNPSDKRVAKRLDNEYHLKERTQTALAYNGKEGVLVELQSEDTSAKLRSLPKLKFKFSKIWQYCLIGVLAVTMALTGALIPAQQAAATIPPVGDADYPWRISQLEIVNMRELISNVKDSHVDDDAKTSVVDVLEDLLTDLGAVTKLGEKNKLVYGAVDEIDGIITPINSYKSYVDELEIWDQEYLAHAVMRGVIIYRSYMLTSYTYVQAFYNEEFELVGDAIAGPIDALRKEFNNCEDLSVKIFRMCTTIGAAITAVGDTEDEIYKVFDWFITQLAEFAQQLPEEEPEVGDPELEDDELEGDDYEVELQFRLNEMFQSFSERLSAALEIQAYNFAMNKFIGNKLKIIFDLPIDADDAPLGEYDPNNPVTPNPIPPAPPGIDDPPGLPDFATNDKIFEPPGSGSGLGGRYVTLEEVYYYYLGILQEMLMEGNLTEEQVRVIRAYFDMLTGGLISD